jgi:hypothetical protein
LQLKKLEYSFENQEFLRRYVVSHHDIAHDAVTLFTNTRYQTAQASEPACLYSAQVQLKMSDK